MVMLLQLLMKLDHYRPLHRHSTQHLMPMDIFKLLTQIVSNPLSDTTALRSSEYLAVGATGSYDLSLSADFFNGSDDNPKLRLYVVIVDESSVDLDGVGSL